MKILKVRPQTRHTTDGIADELLFNRLLSMEQAIRTYRRAISSSSLTLSACHEPAGVPSNKLELPFAASIRDTDVTGWHRNPSTME
jgi:hypothetical protein